MKDSRIILIVCNHCGVPYDRKECTYPASKEFPHCTVKAPCSQCLRAICEKYRQRAAPLGRAAS